MSKYIVDVMSSTAAPGTWSEARATACVNLCTFCCHKMSVQAHHAVACSTSLASSRRLPCSATSLHQFGYSAHPFQHTVRDYTFYFAASSYACVCSMESITQGKKNTSCWCGMGKAEGSSPRKNITSDDISGNIGG